MCVGIRKRPLRLGVVMIICRRGRWVVVKNLLEEHSNKLTASLINVIGYCCVVTLADFQCTFWGYTIACSCDCCRSALVPK
jgi:hypothetical protein